MRHRVLVHPADPHLLNLRRTLEDIFTASLTREKFTSRVTGTRVNVFFRRTMTFQNMFAEYVYELHIICIMT